MICLDTAVLIWGVQGASHPGQNEMIARTRRFLELLVKEGETIMVPAPVVAEYLAVMAKLQDDPVTTGSRIRVATAIRE